MLFDDQSALDTKIDKLTAMMTKLTTQNLTENEVGQETDNFQETSGGIKEVAVGLNQVQEQLPRQYQMLRMWRI